MKQKDIGNYLLKLSANGNRFLIADKRMFHKKLKSHWKNMSVKTNLDFSKFKNLSEQTLDDRSLFFKKLCSYKNLTLTDGLVVVKESQKFLFECDFYNKDGSLAEMCGNATCCMVFYANELDIREGNFQFGKEVFRYKKGKGLILNKKPIFYGNHDFYFGGKNRHFTLVDSGVPHGVLKCPDQSLTPFKNKKELKKISQFLRFKNPKSKKGMNISFFKVKTKTCLQAISYERGIEDWTLSCGTGALATAFVYLNTTDEKIDSLFIQMPGGKLKLELKPELMLFSHVKKGY